MARVVRPAVVTWFVVVINLGVLGFFLGVQAAPLSGTVATISGVLSFTVVGAFVTLRRPDSRIGWLLLATGSVMAVTLAAPEWAAAAHADGPGGLPAPTLGAWIDAWLWIPMLALQFVFLPSLLPSGRPSSRRVAGCLR